jgi:hypothetical protein
VAALGAALGLAWTRNLPLLALAGLPLLVDGVRVLAPRWRGAGACVGAIPGAVLWVGLLAGWGPATDLGRRVPGWGFDPRAAPEAATAVLAAEMAPGERCWNDFHSGGWLAWRLGPGRTYIDGNTDGYPHAFLTRYRATLAGDHAVWEVVPEAAWFFARPDHRAHRTVLAALASHPAMGVRAWTPNGAALARGRPPDPSAEALARADCAAWAAEAPDAVREAVRLRDAPDGARAARLAAVFPYVAGARVAAGRAALAAGDLAGAAHHAAAAAWLRPAAHEAWALLGAARVAAGDRSGARAAYDRAIAEAPAGPDRLDYRAAAARLR